MSRIARPVIGWRGGQPLDRGLGVSHIALGATVQQCLHQNTRRRNTPRQQLSLANQFVDGGAHERYGLVAIPTPGHLTRQVHVDEP